MRSEAGAERKGELRMRVERALLSAAALCGILLLSGCVSTKLGERAIMQAASVDIYDGVYTVNALLFDSDGSSGEKVDPSGENVLKVTGSGDTFTAAVDDISLTDGREIYMSENRLLILGSGFEQEDLSPVLECLVRDMRCSLNMLICCTDDPEKLTDMHFTEGLTSAEKPVGMIENAYRSGISPRARLLDLLNDYAAGESTLIPNFIPEGNGFGMTTDDSGLTAVLSGSKELSGGRFVGELDPEQTVGRLLLGGDTDKLQFSFTHAGKEHSCEAYCIKAETLSDGGVQLSAMFRRRNGERLPEELKNAAVKRLGEILSAANR